MSTPLTSTRIFAAVARRSGVDIANFQHRHRGPGRLSGTFGLFFGKTLSFPGVPTMQIAQRLGRLASHGLLLSVVVLGFEGAASADVAVPPELRGWEDWALQGHETHRCPWLAPGQPTDAARICAWPSVLDLQADEHGGRFPQRWQAGAGTRLPLPGSAGDLPGRAASWPADVTLDGSPAAVVAHDGAPTLRVASGVHTLAGNFRWTRRPELLALPSGVALVSLSINGGHVLNPQRSNVGIVLGTHAV